MPIDEKFGGAYIDGGHRSRHRLLGYPLRPFTPWHLLLLQAVDSPFLRKGVVHLDDVRRLTAICRLAFPDSLIVLPDVPLRERWRLWRRGLAPVVQGVLAYLADFLTKPDFNIHARESSRPAPPRGAAPEIFRVVWDVQGWLHCHEGTVWNMPLAMAYVQQAGALRARGEDIDFNVLTEKERRFQAEMKKRGMKPGDPLPADTAPAPA